MRFLPTAISDRLGRSSGVEDEAAPPADAPKDKAARKGEVSPVPELAGASAGAEPLAAYANEGHLLATSSGVWAFYSLADQDFLGRSGDEKLTLGRAQAHRWAELCGHRVIIRQSSSPFDDYGWARKLDLTYPEPGVEASASTLTHRLPDRDGAVPFDEVLTAGRELAEETGRRKSATVLGVRVSERRVKARDLALLLRSEPLAGAKLEEARRSRARVDVAVSKAGFEGTPLTANSLAWLTHASLGMGAGVPPVMVDYPGRESWDVAAVPGFTNPVAATAHPYALTTTLHIARDNAKHVRHVAVQHVDRFTDRDEDVEPFLAWTLAYPIPLEVVAIFDVVDGLRLKRQAEQTRRTAREIEKHHLEHDQDPPNEVARGIELALDIEDQFANGDTPTRTRLLGTLMVAVTGTTEQEALDAARDLRVAAEEEQGATLFHDYGQYRAWRSFIPGEPWLNSGGHECRIPARFAAHALIPNVSVSAGDPTGFLVGPVVGGHDLMLFDPFGGSRRNLSGVMLTCGNQGSGKSALAGALAWWTARLGVRTVAVDPAGLWKRLTELPDLAPDAHFLDVASATPGTLVPTVMVPEPRLADYRDETEWREAVATANAERVELMVDTLEGLLPWGYRQETRKLTAILTTSCSNVGGAYGEDPWRYVADLREHRGETGKEIADLLAATASLRGGSLVFPAAGRDVDPRRAESLLNRATLTVISTHGLALPPHGMPDRALWTPAQLATIPVLGLVARLATLAMYQDRRSPTHIPIDELRLIATAGSSFPSFINRVTVDSRKWLALVNLLFQSPAMINALDENIGNLAGAAFVGRLDQKDAEAARVMLRDSDPDSGIEERIADQTAGEFHVRDWLGRRREVYVDQSWWHDALYEALDTTPGSQGAYDDAPGSLFGVPA